MEYQTTIPLRPSAQIAVAGTETGTGIQLLRSYESLVVVFDITTIGDDTQAADTLDVYVDAGYYDAVNAATVWINIGRFTQITGVDAEYATGVFTLTGVIVPGSHAVNVLTVTGGGTQIADGYTVTIGATVYTWKTALTGGGSTAYEVLIGVSDTTALANLRKAINATGVAGTDYGTGTLVHPTVVASASDATTLTVNARIPGTAANATATTETGAETSWADTTLGGGTGASNPGVAAQTITIGARTYSFVDVLSETNGAAAIADQVLFGADSAAALDNLKLAINAGATAGTNYSTGTVAHAQVNATTNTDTAQTVVADATGSAGNSIATTDTVTNGNWGAATLAGGTSGPGVIDRQTLAWHVSQLESSQPVNSDADLGSAGVRKIGFFTSLRYRGVVTGSTPSFTYSVIGVAK